jgi:hypothetical protein
MTLKPLKAPQTPQQDAGKGMQLAGDEAELSSVFVKHLGRDVDEEDLKFAAEVRNEGCCGDQYDNMAL